MFLGDVVKWAMGSVCFHAVGPDREYLPSQRCYRAPRGESSDGSRRCHPLSAYELRGYGLHMCLELQRWSATEDSFEYLSVLFVIVFVQIEKQLDQRFV